MTEQTGALVEIDPAKLGTEGHKLLGKIEVLTKWAARFMAFHAKSLDLAERKCLSDVIGALTDDMENTKHELAVFAQKRGAAKVTPAEVKPAEPIAAHVVEEPTANAGNDNAA